MKYQNYTLDATYYLRGIKLKKLSGFWYFSLLF